MKRAVCMVAALFLFGVLCFAQEQPKPVLKVDQTSSGPFGGEKGASCLIVYSDGRVVYTSWSAQAMGVEDEHGKVTHPVSKDSREYRFPERDSWQVSTFIDFLQSKAVRSLKSYFPPPHPPIDFLETSTVQVIFQGGKSKQIQTREYYVASLVEKAKYPSALIILMDKIEQLENTLSDKGTPTEVSPECRLEPPESAVRH